MSGIGTVDNPWDFATALSSGSVSAGDRIRLRGGTYNGDFASALNGSSHYYPIYIEPYPGERPIINGKFALNGRYTRVQGLEFTSDFENRISQEASSDPTDLTLKGGVRVSGVGNELINCIVHDCLDNGLADTQSGTDTLLYGNIVYHNGWSGPERGHGHGTYSQNDGTTKRSIIDNLFFDGFCLGIKIYTQSQGTARNYDVIGNICFQAESLYLGPGAINEGWNIYAGRYGGSVGDILFRDNLTYINDPKQTSPQNRIGWHDGVDGIRLVDNYFPEGVLFTLADIVENTGNYYGTAVGDRVFVRKNQYNTTRAHLAIYNQSQSVSISVDISDIYENGDIIAVRNAQDYFVDIQQLQVENGTITVSMENHTVATPKAWSAPITTFPLFGCFVLEKL